MTSSHRIICCHLMSCSGSAPFGRMQMRRSDIGNAAPIGEEDGFKSAAKCRSLNSQTGFTLLELAIVLVIVGLLAGGVLVGRELIRSAELRSITTDLQSWDSAVEVFRERYHVLPGDMPNATANWGHATACGGSNASGTCNGNGDGTISEDGAWEWLLFWDHLARAGLIPGTYQQRVLTGGNYYPVDLNPPSRSGGIWLVQGGMQFTGRPPRGYGFYLNSRAPVDQLANCYSGHGPLCRVNPVLTPEEARGLDGKIDDGKPGVGKVQVHWRTSDCATGNMLTSYRLSQYNINQTAKACSLSFPRENNGWEDNPNSDGTTPVS